MRSWKASFLAQRRRNTQDDCPSRSAVSVAASLGVPLDEKHQIAHNKIIIIDGQIVITGSFNFTKSAEEHNAENLLIIHSKDLAAKYTTNWQVHAGHSVTYEGR